MTRKDLLKEALVEYLDSQNWRYTVREDNDTVFIASLGMNIDCRLKSCDLLVIASESDIQSIGSAPINADEEDYDTVVEYITRANRGLKIGKFEFDYRDGEVTYQAALSCIETDPAQRDIERTVDMPVIMLERYGDGLAKALMGFGDPEADIKAAENN